MTDANQSPIVQFLLSPDNLPSVIEILRHEAEVRKQLGLRFFEKLQDSLGAARPQAFTGELSWENDFARNIDAAMKDEGFGLDGMLTGIGGQKLHGLKFRIEVGPTWFGVGLAWLRKEREHERLRALKSVKNLLRELKARRADRGSDNEPPDFWLWWEYWEEKVYPVGERTSWLAKPFNPGDKPKKFWEFVLQFYTLVVEANSTLVQVDLR